MKTYSEYKDSGITWIGEIPSHWRISRTKNNFTIITGATPKSDQPEYWDGGIKWITPADYKTNDKYVFSGRNSLTTAGFQSCGTTLVPKGSIIFSKRAPIGTVAISAEELCTNQGCLSCIPSSKANNVFFYYTMSVFTEQFEMLGSGTTFKEISANAFENFYFATPTYEEQIVIASFLDKKVAQIEALITEAKASIDEYKQWKASIIYEAVTKGLDPNVEMKDSGVEWIGEMPINWASVRLKQLVSHKTARAESNNGYIGLENVESASGRFLLGSKAGFEAEGTSLAVSRGDVLFGKLRPYLAKCAIAESEGCCSTEFIVMEARAINPTYLKYIMLSPKFIDVVNMSTYGAKMPRANWDFIGNIVVPVPSISIQSKICELIESQNECIMGLIQEKEALISDLEAYKKSLIFEVVTGKRKVV